MTETYNPLLWPLDPLAHFDWRLWTAPGHTVSSDTSDSNSEELHASCHGVADEVHCMQLRGSKTY